MEKQRSLESGKTFSNIGSVNFNDTILTKEIIKKKYIYNIGKRLLDIFGSACGLILLSPLFLIISFAIKREGKKAPVFFSQTRIGQNGEKFKMYKFRTMCVEAEEMLPNLLEFNEVDGAMFKIKEDPRVTKIGKFLRKTSIDELPQLLNVLIGEMSLVGPRPPLEREVEQYTNYDKQRLLAKPGCTGIWQISGRNNIDFHGMVEMDISYIKKMNIFLDLKIILKTVWVMIKPNGAY